MDINVYLFENNELRQKPILDFLDAYNAKNAISYKLIHSPWRNTGGLAETDFSDSDNVLSRVDGILADITKNNIKALFLVDLALTEEEENYFANEIYYCELSKKIVGRLRDKNQAIIIESSVSIEVFRDLIKEWQYFDYEKIKYLPAWDFESIHQDKMIAKVSHFMKDFFEKGATK